MQFIINVFRVAISLIFLGYASWSDIKTREVSNKVWLLYAPLGLMLTLFEGLLYEDYDYWLFAGISIALTFTLAVSLFYLGAFGGADAKAFMCLALAFPTYPKFSWNTHIMRLHYFFPVTIFTNSI
ncbi:prepilin peptidase, partial [Candidatus Bathyarchaeota archaeon]|nr:prepilin peptidase [Candidatus Bathyarchaeota archaeon]